MIFVRTESGLSNQRYFFEVDLVAYVEGEKDRRPKLELGSGEAQSRDALFWSEVITAEKGDIRIHFKELGSKTALLELAQKLDCRAVGRILICIDRDFDDFLPPRSHHRSVVRTYAYSWEADVWSLQVVARIVETFLPVAALPIDERAHLEQIWGAFYDRIGRFILLDAKFVVLGRPGILDRSSPSSAVLVEKSRPPVINSPFFRAKLSRVRGDCPRPWGHALNNRVESDRHLFGKVAMCFGYQVVVYMMRHLGVGSQMSSELINSLAIRAFGAGLRNGGANKQRAYYGQQLRAAGV